MAVVYGTTGGEMSFAGIAAKAAVAGQNPLFMVGVYLVHLARVFVTSIVVRL